MLSKSRYMTMLPMYSKLGKMLILGATFNCLDPVLTIVTGLSVRDPFLTPMDKKDHNEKSFSLKKMEDGQVLLYSDDHLKMLGGYLEFFMKLALAEMYQSLRRELNDLIQNKLVEVATTQFSRDYSDHLALVRAYQGWKEVERDVARYEYC